MLFLNQLPLTKAERAARLKGPRENTGYGIVGNYNTKKEWTVVLQCYSEFQSCIVALTSLILNPVRVVTICLLICLIVN